MPSYDLRDFAEAVRRQPLDPERVQRLAALRDEIAQRIRRERAEQQEEERQHGSAEDA